MRLHVVSFVLVVLLMTTGCAGKFTLIDRSDGKIHTGSTDGGTVGGSGTATIQIEGESYTGPWIYQAKGGSFGFSNFNGTTNVTGNATSYGIKTGLTNTNLTGHGTTFGTATTMGVSAVGDGMVNARAPSGKFIRCVFTFNTMNNTGIGECLRNDGRAYDLQVKR